MESSAKFYSGRLTVRLARSHMVRFGFILVTRHLTALGMFHGSQAGVKVGDTDAM